MHRGRRPSQQPLSHHDLALLLRLLAKPREEIGIPFADATPVLRPEPARERAGRRHQSRHRSTVLGDRDRLASLDPRKEG